MFEREPSIQTPEGDADAQAQVGNRPAQNARHSEGTGSIGRTWRGGEGATDFLGLDPTLRGVMENTAVHGDAAGVGTDPAAQGTDGAGLDSANSWLLGLDEADPASAGAVPEELVEVPAQADVTFSEKSAPGTPWLRHLVRGVAAIALIAVGLALYALYSTSNTDTGETTIANQAPIKPRPRAKTTDELSLPGDADASAELGADGKAQPRPTPPFKPAASTAAADQAGSPEIARLAPDGVPPLPETDGTPSESTWWAGSQPSDPTGSAGASADLTTALEGRPGADRMEDWMRTHAGTAFPSLDTVPEVRVTPNTGHEDLFGGAQANDPHGVVAVPTTWRLKGPSTNSKSKLRRATAEDLAGLWEGTTIPMEAIEASARLLTPVVGRVRAILKGGEIFEGRLYAVGQGMIWLDNDLGRMALLEDQLDKLEQLSSVAGTPALGDQGSQELLGLPRVRVRTPGGMFYGKTIARTDATITLITDEGARVTLESVDVEPAPLNQTVVVRPNKR